MTTIFKDFIFKNNQNSNRDEVINYMVMDNKDILLQPNSPRTDKYFLDWIEKRYMLKVSKQIEFDYLGCFKVTKGKICYILQKEFIPKTFFFDVSSIDFEKLLDSLVLPVLNINTEDINHSKILKILMES